MKSQCRACGEFFATVSQFDAHRVGKHGVKAGENMRRCLSKTEMESKKWKLNEKGIWKWPTRVCYGDQISTQNSDRTVNVSKTEMAFAGQA